jgi:DNA-binding MarR family transcriptional regulator
MAEARWLTTDEQRSWRAFLRGTHKLFDHLESELRTAHGLSGDDYEVLVALSEGPPEGIRMSVLAENALMSRSRLTYTVDRMERDGLLERVACPEDGRGLRAALTRKGQKLLETAAVTHVEGVRRWLLDVLTEREFNTVGTAFARVLEQLPAAGVAAGATADRTR